ncbi:MULTISPECIES: DinB family protein [unclassified Meiothermus]|uniref:DinB family protein n=1 Tax=unclassified Meiothermus TaxID=370471 RepID=UPI000D7BBBDF|nr:MULTISPECIES: DinB family protein [unclassified Meiothermus]PZA05919.1 DinB family protein [Meiothermus sp. Pnk-1]RYM39400.1 DinB family protein [Meiothermus sp. PNK-Is4]
MDKTALLGRLETQLSALELILRAPPEALDAHPIPEKWSARQNLAHLGRFHEVFLARLEQILAEDNPRLASRTPDNDPDLAAWMELPTPEIINRIRPLRLEILERLRDLPEEQWARSGVHPLFGPMDIGELLEHFLIHEGHHLYVALQRSRGH